MLFIHFFAISGALIFAVCRTEAERGRGKLMKNHLLLLFCAAGVLRILAAALSQGFGTDTACFASWADRIFTLGPGGFYSPDVFTDYPPGYMYVLWVLGAVRNLLGMEYYSVPHLILLKLPAIACDLACGLLLYKECAGKCSQKQAFFLCAAYLFNPAVILNSSVWGQVDSVFTLAVVFMCLCLIRGKMYPAYLSFAVGVLIKPQTLLFAPVLLAGIIDHVFLTDFSWQKFFKNLIQGLSAVAALVLASMPFGLLNVWKQYFSTVGSYPYAAVNACNLWGLFGLNWISQDETFLGIPYRIFGTAAIAAAIVLVLLLSLRNKRDHEKYPFLGALLVLSIYVFSVRMHERYMYPGLLLLLLAYVYKPSKHIYLCYGAFSILHFYNTANVLFYYDPSNYDRKSTLILLVSAGMLLCGVFLYYITYKLYRGAGAEAVAWKPSASGSYTKSVRITPLPPMASRRAPKLKLADILCMSVITLIYSCIALYDLGDGHAPVSTFDLEENQSIALDFGSQIPVTLSYYMAPWQDRVFTLDSQSQEGGEWINFGEVTLRNVFTWQTVFVDTGASRIRLTLKDNQASMIEWCFLDAEGNLLRPLNADAYPGLFDEQELHPEESSFRNSMYFDEIYHGRTAYEFVNGLTSYENTHPPLGKIFIALGTLLFGMNPFGWRIAGTLFGIAMVPFLYLFARRISESTSVSALACVLFTFDFMHFTQTRIATIDVYITFFVIVMYYLMYQYWSVSFYDTELKKTWLPLGACGVCMGLGVASKWTGVYAGIGLALIFFSVLYKRYREYLYAKKKPTGQTAGILHKKIIESFAPCTKKTILFCLVFFVALPALIYLLSYLPFRDYSDRGLFDRMLHNQETMFSYHSGLESTHDYSSPWHEWPTIKRPIWYYSRILPPKESEENLEGTANPEGAEGLEKSESPEKSEGLREGISAFGNPAVWWMGIPAAFYMIYLWFNKKDRTAGFLFTGYLAQYLPWFFVTRITFIYHYFPSVAFVVLMIIYSMMQWKPAIEKRSKYAFPAMALLYGTLVVVLFAMFYPVLSGQPVSPSYVAKYLRWFESWTLTAK